MPEISVVVPLYNKEKYINRCLNSIFNQTYQDFEVIVVNDGSSDQSEKRVLEYKDPRLVLINKPNGGEASARNRGIKEAKGAIVAFLDADDQWLPRFLEKIMNLSKKYPIAQVFSSSVFHNNGQRFIYSTTKKMFPPNWEGIVDPKLFLEIGFPFNSSSVAITRNIFDKYGYFDEHLKIGTDTNMWFRLILLVPFVHSNEYLSEVYLNSINRSGYENASTDLSLLLQKSIDEAKQFSPQIPADLQKIMDREKTIFKLMIINRLLPRNQRWRQVLKLIKHESLAYCLLKTKRITVKNKILQLSRIMIWFIYTIVGMR